MSFLTSFEPVPINLNKYRERLSVSQDKGGGRFAV